MFPSSPDELNAYAAMFAAFVALLIPLSGLWWKFLTRPQLAVDFSNKAPWCRLANVNQSAILARFVRVRVTNKGWTAARVSGRLVAMTERSGEPSKAFDPVALHWAGTPYGPGDNLITLLPGQTEFLDVLRIDWDRKKGLAKFFETHFSPVLQDDTPRGIPQAYPIEGQTLRVVVISEYSSGAGIELKLPGHDPEDALASIFTFALKFRPVDAWTGLGLVPWETDSPTPASGDYPTVAQ